VYALTRSSVRFIDRLLLETKTRESYEIKWPTAVAVTDSFTMTFFDKTILARAHFRNVRGATRSRLAPVFGWNFETLANGIIRRTVRVHIYIYIYIFIMIGIDIFVMKDEVIGLGAYHARVLLKSDLARVLP